MRTDVYEIEATIVTDKPIVNHPDVEFVEKFDERDGVFRVRTSGGHEMAGYLLINNTDDLALEQLVFIKNLRTRDLRMYRVSDNIELIEIDD